MCVSKKLREENITGIKIYGKDLLNYYKIYTKI